MAEYVSTGFDSAKENERKFGERRNVTRFNKTEIGIKSQSGESQRKITVGMTDEERYQILKGKTIDNVPTVTDADIVKASINSWEDINKVLGQEKKR